MMIKTFLCLICELTHIYVAFKLKLIVRNEDNISERNVIISVNIKYRLVSSGH